MVYPHWGSSPIARKQNMTQFGHRFPVTKGATTVLLDSLKLQNVINILAQFFPSQEERPGGKLQRLFRVQKALPVKVHNY